MGAYNFIIFIPFIIYLAIIIFAIYFVVKIIKFMNEKIKLDQERNKQINELIRVLSENKHVE